MISTGRKRYKTHNNKKNKESVFLSQILVCISVTAIIFSIKSIKSEPTVKISEHIKNTLYYNIDVKESFTELKNLLNEVIKNDITKEIEPSPTPDSI